MPTWDGVDGANTRDAVKAFQAAESLTVDGVAGAQTCKALVDAVADGRVYKPADGFDGRKLRENRNVEA